MKKTLIGAASALTVGLAGCGWISGAAINDATEACRPHGGIKAIHPVYVNISPSYEVDCSDGKTIFGRAKDDR